VVAKIGIQGVRCACPKSVLDLKPFSTGEPVARTYATRLLKKARYLQPVAPTSGLTSVMSKKDSRRSTGYDRRSQIAMIRNIRGMICTVSGTSERVQAGRRHKFARSDNRTPEP
jgi:hypothetical protein